MNHSHKDKLKFSQLLAPVAVSASGNSASVDLQDCNEASLLLCLGTMAFDSSNYLSVTIEHSDDNSSFSACAEEDMYSPESASVYKKLDSASEDEMVHAFPYRGNKRYIRLAYAETGTVSVTASVIAVLGRNELNPAL